MQKPNNSEQSHVDSESKKNVFTARLLNDQDQITTGKGEVFYFSFKFKAHDTHYFNTRS